MNGRQARESGLRVIALTPAVHEAQIQLSGSIRGRRSSELLQTLAKGGLQVIPGKRATAPPLPGTDGGNDEMPPKMDGVLQRLEEGGALRGERRTLARPAIAREGDAGEAERHHRPGRGLRDCRRPEIEGRDSRRLAGPTVGPTFWAVAVQNHVDVVWRQSERASVRGPSLGL
jgi:hypothetical protein